jgi:hypothetical protein
MRAGTAWRISLLGRRHEEYEFPQQLLVRPAKRSIYVRYDVTWMEEIHIGAARTVLGLVRE